MDSAFWLILSRRQCWWHHRPLQKRANRGGLQPERAGVRAGRRSPLPILIFVSVMRDSQMYLLIYLFCAFCSIRNKFSPTRSTAEKFITLSGGNQKTLSTKTLSRKATSSSTKVKSVACSCASGACGAPDRSGSILNLVCLALRQRQAVEEPLLHPGGNRRPAHLLWEWKESNQTQRADRSERVLCVWCAWQSVWQVSSEILFESDTCSALNCFTLVSF